MRTLRLTGDAAEAAVLAGCTSAWERLHARIAHRFGRAEVRARVRRFVAGLLARVERKNGWQRAEAIGEVGPQGVQRLLNGTTWDADAVRDDLRTYVVEHIGDLASGVLIIDETSFPKKGTHSCGVAPQYCGTLGHSANAQVAVFLAYTSRRGTAFIDRALYLPQAWTRDVARCAAAGVPPEVGFATKIALAKQLLTRAFAAAVPARWVVADSFYGRGHPFREWLEEHGRAYVVSVLPKQVVVVHAQRQRAEAVVASLPSSAWVCRSAGLGSQGERIQAWTWMRLDEAVPAGMQRWLLVRRSLADPNECAYFRAYGPVDTTVEELVRVAGSRWAIEEGFAQAKGEVGLDQYEVRQWTAWYRHITLCLFAHAYLVVVGMQARQAGGGRKVTKRNSSGRPLLTLTVPEVRRLMQAVHAVGEQQAFLLGWSRWRRTHQATANHYHSIGHMWTRAKRVEPPGGRAIGGSELTETAWSHIRALMPPPALVGRPCHDHRTVINGILWVLRTASPWREMPRQFGKWDTAYARYRLWCSQGRWQHIMEALEWATEPPTPPPKPERRTSKVSL